MRKHVSFGACHTGTNRKKNLGLKGSVEDWVLSYDAELTAVTDSRMVELHGEEREIALKSGNLIKLRMLLKRKKCFKSAVGLKVG